MRSSGQAALLYWATHTPSSMLLTPGYLAPDPKESTWCDTHLVLNPEPHASQILVPPSDSRQSMHSTQLPTLRQASRLSSSTASTSEALEAMEMT